MRQLLQVGRDEGPKKERRRHQTTTTNQSAETVNRQIKHRSPKLHNKPNRGLGCFIRVTPWLTAISVLLIGTGLPFW